MRAECSIDGCVNRQVARTWCDTHYRRWVRMGTPYRGELSVEDKSTRHVQRNSATGCWIWTGHITRWGYGRHTMGRGNATHAHRWSYEHFVGPVPDGLELDHICHSTDLSCRGGPTCRHRRCCNPAHLEPVTHAENIGRGRTRPLKTHCKYGHEFNETNTHVFIRRGDGATVRACRPCARDRQRRAEAAKRLANA